MTEHTVPVLPSGDTATFTPSEGGSTGEAPKRAQKRSHAYVRLTYSCGGCDTRWSGAGRAHCSACHRTFSGPDGFDQHRRDINDVGTCIDPATLVVKRGARKGEHTQVLRGDVWCSAREFTNAGELFGGDR
jgi:hypothetical protein